jgi:predicted acylesterase/phospholipase RssA
MESTTATNPLRVLSLDGGGMRGLYTATLLNSLASCLRGKPVDIGSAFDVIVGTSTGGILATALALGVPIQEIVSLYRKVGPNIFVDPQPQPNSIPTVSQPPPPPKCKLLLPIWMLRLNWWMFRNRKNLKSITEDPFVLWCKRNLNKSANNPEPLREELTRLFQDTTFGQLHESRKVGLCLTAVKVLDEKLRVFKTPHNSIKNYDVNLKLVDACMATSAAPLYLPLAVLPNPQMPESEEVYADGGLAVNNPVLIGLIEALQLAGNSGRPIEIFSVGTCAAPEGAVVPRAEADRGLAQWKVGAKALGLSMNAQASAANYAAGYLANWFTQHSNTAVKVIRFPEAHRSEAHMQFLKMDNASEGCCQAFMQFGNDDAMAAKSMCDKDDDAMGRAIKAVFHAMKEFDSTP